MAGGLGRVAAFGLTRRRLRENADVSGHPPKCPNGTLMHWTSRLNTTSIQAPCNAGRRAGLLAAKRDLLPSTHLANVYH
jgi:hypothetical protein